MAVQFIPFSPLGGVNSELLPDSIGDGEVVDSSNFIFARKRAITRPGVSTYGLAGTGNIIFAKYVRGRLWYFCQSSTGTRRLYLDSTGEITGAGISANPQSGCSVNNATLFPNGVEVTRYPGSGAVYTQVAHTAHYMVGHNSRAVSAYMASYPRRVSWSVVGDETDWTGVGSGHTDLSDAITSLNGIGVMNDTVVVCRSDGFHFGYPTGSGSMPYRFENKSQGGIGPWFPSATIFYDDMLFFVGSEDIYLFSKEGLRPIGGGAREEILAAAFSSGVTTGYCGLVTTTFGGEPGIFYHLAPAFPSLLSGASYARDWLYSTRPAHYTYNLREGKWSKFNYAGRYGGLFALGNYITKQPIDTLASLGGETGTDNFHVKPSVALEEEAFLRSKSLLVDSPEKDFTLRRLMLRYRNVATAEVVVEASADLNGIRWGVSDRVAVGVDPPDGRMKRQWVNLEVTGNDFEFKVTVPPGNKLETNMLGGSFEPAPEYQGS